MWGSTRRGPSTPTRPPRYRGTATHRRVLSPSLSMPDHFRIPRWLVPIAIAIAIALALLPASVAAAPSDAPDLLRLRGPGALPEGVEQPDIVVLVIDDLAQMDDRLWQRLPTIRRLFLESGLRFTDYVGNDPLCCPGRVNLLTGQWTLHHGVSRNDARLSDSSVTVATELRATGYWTGIFGKYLNQTLQLPDKWPPGWDEAFIFGGNYWNFPAWANGVQEQIGGEGEDYSTTVVQERAVAALRAAPPDRPRLVWLTPFAIHGGYDQQRVRTLQPHPAPQDVGAAACADVEPWSTPANFELDITDKPAYIQRFDIIPARPLVRSCEALLSVDRLLAAVLDELATQGRPEPLVVLTADNGMAWGSHRWMLKTVPYAVPMPLFMSWPALLGEAPASLPVTVTNVDIAPTLCAIAGCTMGPFRNGHGVDGVSLLPLLVSVGEVNRGATAAMDRALPSGLVRTFSGEIHGLDLAREVVFMEHRSDLDARGMPPWQSVRTTTSAPIGRWSWTRYRTGEVELYDLSGGPCWTWQPGDPGDPCMLTNVAADPAYRAIRAILATTLDARERRPQRLSFPLR